MRPTSVSVTGVGNSAVIVPDYLTAPFALGIAVKVTGTVNYTVQHTFDDVFDPNFNPATATWIDHATLAAQTTTKDSNYAFPVRGIRLVVNSGTGTAQLVVVSAGHAGGGN